MNVLFLYQDRSLPSSRVRVLNLADSISTHGIHVTLLEYPRGLGDKIKLFRSIHQYDLVFLQRKLITFFDLMLLRARAKKLIFDFDDAIYRPDDHAGKSHSNTRSQRFRSIIQRADFITAGNEVLAEEARKYNPNIAIVPSAVPVTGIPTKDSSAENPRVRIGWIGTKGNLPYLEKLNPIFQKLAQDFPLEIHVVTDVDFECPGVPVVNKRWKLEEQESNIAQFDIGVMPLPDTDWARGKCGYKSLQYMAGGVPSVCSDVGANAEGIEDGVDGLKAATYDDFYEKLKQLIEDPDLRKSMGQAARKKVIDRYSVETVAKQIASIIHQQVTNTPRGTV